MQLLFLLFFAYALIIPSLGGCSPEPTSVVKTVQQSESPSTFGCGDLSCSIAEEYCYRAFPGAVIPGTKGYSESCRALPHPDCSEVERSGKCTGSLDTGITIEVYFP